MRLVAVSRVLNEDDIIEAFVRHTLAHVDSMVLLDNGSCDRTVEILRALRAEGLPIVVMQAPSVIFNELSYNTLLYHTATLTFQPDWVLHLDADEFLDTRDVSVRAVLETVAAEAQAVKLTLRNYYPAGLDAADLLVPRRIGWRDVTERGVQKCMVRSGLGSGLVVDIGNHEAWIDGQRAVSLSLPALPLAHYPIRHPLQELTKAAVGRLKVVARGGGPEVMASVSAHYEPVLRLLRDDPGYLLRDAARMSNALPAMPLAEDPIHYAGSELRYTLPTDYAMKAVRCLAQAAERLALSHGDLLDADPQARDRLQSQSTQAELLLS